MGLKTFIIAAAVIALPTVAEAQSTTLTTGTGDGSVSINLETNGYSANTGNGIYDPIGAGGPASTIFQSYLLYGIGGSNTRTALTAGTFSATSATSATSTFSGTGFTGSLLQTVEPTFQGGPQTGSLLTQVYTFNNATNAPLVLNLLRYLDGDLAFDGSISDGGGRLTAPGGTPLLFEIDSATGAATANTFVGIYNVGGTATGFQISQCCGGQNNSALNNTIFNDGNSDGFIDAGAGYDVTLNLSALLTIGAGNSGTFTTYTLFGTGAPGEVVVPGVPEPTSWAMMIGGFGLVGGAMRRRARTTTTVRFA